MIVKEGWLHLKLGGPCDWVRVFVSLDDCVLSVVADAQASLLPAGSCVSFDLAAPGSHVVVAGEMLTVWRTAGLGARMQCDFLCASSAEEADDWARAVEVTGGAVERKVPASQSETAADHHERGGPLDGEADDELDAVRGHVVDAEVDIMDGDGRMMLVRDSDAAEDGREDWLSEELDERINQSLSTHSNSVDAPPSIGTPTRARGSICKLSLQSAGRYNWRDGVFAFKCSNRTVVMKPEGLSEAMEGDWIVCDEDGDVFAVNAVKFDRAFTPAPGSRKNYFRRVGTVYAKQMTDAFIAVNDEVVYHGRPGDYLVQDEEGHQWVCLGTEFDNKFIPAPDLSPRPSSSTQDLGLRGSGPERASEQRDTEVGGQASPSEVLKMELTPKIAKWYVRRATVHAFKSKDPTACKKSWGWDQGDTGDWLIFMSDDTTAGYKIMTCSAEDFAQHYEQVENQPHKYREKGKVLGLRMHVNFAAVRSSGFQMGVSGDYLVQDEVGNQWVAPPSVFLKQYSPALEQSKDDDGDEEAQSAFEAKLRSNLRDIVPMSRTGTLWNVQLPTEAKHDDELCWAGSLMKRSRHLRQWRKRYFRLYADSFTYSRQSPADDNDDRVQEEFPIELHSCDIESIELDGKDVICIRPCTQRHASDAVPPEGISGRDSIGSSNAAEPIMSPSTTSSKSGRHATRGGGTAGGSSTSSSEPETIYLQAASERQHAMLLVLLKSGVVNATKQRVFEACRADDVATFNRLLQTVAEDDRHYILHSPNSIGDWIVHVAAEGRPNVLAAMVPHTNEFNRPNRAGKLPLYLAAASGDRRCVSILIEEGADPRLETKDGETPLHAAANGTVVSLLLEYRALVNVEDHFGRSPLMTAASRADVSAVEALLDAGATINAQSWRTGQSSLHYAVQAMRTCPENAQSAVELLLRRGAKPAITDLQSQTALHAACAGYVAACAEGVFSPLPSHIQCIRALVDAGVDLTARDHAGCSPFSILCRCKPHAPVDCCPWTDLLDMVLGLANPQTSVDILYDNDQAGRSCLHIAAETGNLATVRYLLDKQADVNAKEIKGLTPLDLLNRRLKQTTDSVELEQLRACETFLIEHGGYKRRKASLPVETDRPDIKFASDADGSCSVKAATFETLVKRVCTSAHYEDGDALAVLLCSRTVSSDEELLGILVRLLQNLFSDERRRSDSEADADRGAHSTRPTLRLMGQWFETVFSQRPTEDARVVQLLAELTTLLLKHDPTSFSQDSQTLFQDILGDSTPARASRLVEAWVSHCPGLKALAKFSVATANIYRPVDILLNLQSNSSKIQHIIRLAMQQQLKSAKVLGVVHGPGASQAADPHAPGLCAYKPFDVAQQMSVAAHYLLRKIPLSEFLSLKYSDPSITPNIAVLKQWNEKCIAYFMHEILIRPSPDKRADVICHLIRVAQQLLHVVMNHDGLMIILQVLESTSIYRLKQTWARVNRKLPRAWEEIKEQCGIGGRKLARLASTIPPSEPFMPYVGMIMQVLVNLHEMPSVIRTSDADPSADSTGTFLVHFAKWRRIAEMAQNIQKWQQTPYLIEVNPDLQFLFQSSTPYHDEARQLKRSDELEPPVQGGKPPQKGAWFS